MQRIQIDKDLTAKVVPKDDEDPNDPGQGFIRVHYRTQEEYDAIAKALQFGNRRERRNKILIRGDRGDGGAVFLTEHERNRRNAARRVARKSRKRNGGRR